MSDALLAMAMEGRTSNQILLDIDRARMINSVMGGAVVGPWEMDDFPLEWIQAFEGIMLDLPSMQRNMNEVEAIKAKWRNEYRQRYKH